MFSKIFTLFFILVSLEALAGSIPQAAKVTSFGAAGVAVDSILDPDPIQCVNPGKMQTIEAVVNCTADGFYPLYTGASVFTVAATQRFEVYRSCANTATTGVTFQMAWGSASIAQGATSLTNPQYQYGIKGNTLNNYWYPVVTANVEYCEDGPISIVPGGSVLSVGVQCANSNRQHFRAIGRTCNLQ